MKPKICVSIQARTSKQTIDEIKGLAGKVDLVEIRLDYREETLDLRKIVKESGVPCIATNRRADQGGLTVEPEDERVKLLKEAVQAGFRYVDIASTTTDLVSVVSKLKEKGAKVIASYHDFKNPLTRAEIEKKYSELRVSGCDIVKIIGLADSIQSNVPYIQFNNEYPGNISFGMGTLGTTSRIIAPLSGALFTYASSSEGKELAPGQVPYNTLREIYGRISS